jgi:hypothetical protein
MIENKNNTSVLPDFSWYNIPKWGKIYPMTPKYSQWPQNIPIGRIINQLSIKYTNILLGKTLQNLPKSVVLVLKWLYD